MCFLWGKNRIIIREETSKISTQQSKCKTFGEPAIMWEAGHCGRSEIGEMTSGLI